MHCDSPIGPLLLAEKEGALAGLWFEGQKYYLGSLKGEEKEEVPTEMLMRTKAWLNRYFSGEKPEIGELTLAPSGSEFRRAVWKILCEIPYGEVTTYAKIARRIAEQRGCASMSAQAVGGAVGHNPISSLSHATA